MLQRSTIVLFTWYIIFVILCILPLSFNSFAQELDAPHDASFGSGCQTCHDMMAYDQPNLIPTDPDGNGEPHVQLNIDDTLYNNVCWECHDGSSAIKMITHSSLQTDSHYGNWSVECSVCHNQHTQEQDRAHNTSYGKFLRTNIDLSKISGANKSGIKNVKFVNSTGANSFADGDTTIDGICEVCHTRTHHWRNDGSRAGYGVHSGLEESDCMSCHPHDEGFKVDCIDCHGFPPEPLAFTPAPTGSSTAGVHTTHTDKNYPCQYCHKDSVGRGLTHGDEGDGFISMGFSLFYGTYEGGNYDGQNAVNYNVTPTSPVATTAPNTGTMTCTNIFCHGRMPDGSLWGGGTDTSPTWDGNVSCGDCHRATAAAPPTSGQHYKHAKETNSGYNYSCSICHTNPTVDGSFHGNNQSEVIFSSDPMSQGGTYNGDTDMLGSYGTCDNIYCHSTAQSSPPGSGPAYRTTPAWNGSMGGCDKCHYTWGSIPGLTTGSHDQHFFRYETQQCFSCHNWGGTDDPCFACHDAAVNPIREKHANYEVNVEFMPSYGGTYSGTKIPGDAYGKCDNTYCHSNGTSVSTDTIPTNSSPDWGTAGPLACDSCHSNPPAYALFVPKANDHERHNSILNGNPSRTGYSCEICHYLTTTDGSSITNTDNHVNGQYEVSPSPTYPQDPGPSSVNLVNDFTYTYNTGGGTCTNITCHAENGRATTSKWGQSASMTVNFSRSTGIGCYGVSVMAATPNCDPAHACQAPYTYTWDFGDGTVINGSASETHDYNTNGSFDISLNIKSSTGLNETRTIPGVSPTAPANIKPTINQTIAVAGMTATITDLSVDPDFDFCDHSGPAQVRIDWDDGVVETHSLNLTDVPSNQTFQHTYVSAGDKTIKYYIWDNADTWWLTTYPNTSITVPQ